MRCAAVLASNWKDAAYGTMCTRAAMAALNSTQCRYSTKVMPVGLLPYIDPYRIERLFRRYITHITPSTVQTTIRTQKAVTPALLDRHHPAMSAAVTAYQRGFGATPVFLRSGGSLPVVNTFQELL